MGGVVARASGSSAPAAIVAHSDLSEAVNAPDVTDLVYSDADGILYLTTSSGDVLRWSAEAGAFLSPIHVGGTPSSIAVTPDGSAVLVGDDSVYNYGTPKGHTQVDRVSLATLVTTRLDVPLATQEAGVYDLAIAANGQAMITQEFSGSGFTEFWEFPAATATSIGGTRVNVGSSVPMEAHLITSDHGRYVLVQDDFSSAANQWLYDSQADRVVATTSGPFHFGGGDISESAGLIAQISGSTAYVETLQFGLVKTLTLPSSHWVGGLHFSADGKELFVVDANLKAVEIFDTTSWAQTGSIQLTGLPTGAYNAHMDVSADGRYLFVQTDGVLESIDLSAAPTATPARPAYHAGAIPQTAVSIYGGSAIFPTSATSTILSGAYVVAADQQLNYDDTHSPAFKIAGPAGDLTIQGSVSLASSTANRALTGIDDDGGYPTAAHIKVAAGGRLQVQATGAGAEAFGSLSTSSVENDGSWLVSATGHAFGLANSGSVNFTNTGTFSVTGDVAAGVVPSEGAVFANSGHFTVTGTSAAVGAILSASKFSNSGDITVTSQNGRAVALEVIGEYGSYSPVAEISNTGTITAQTALLTYVSSDSFGSTQLIHLTNSGTINGEVDLGIGGPQQFAQSGGKGSQVVNTGAIHGAIHFEDGDVLYDGVHGIQTGGIYLGAGDDRALLGDDGETVFGGSGYDFIVGGAGDDVVNGDQTGRTTFSYENASSAVIVNLGVSGAQNTGGGGTDTLVNVSGLVGSNYGDTLTASGPNQTLEGGGGDDTLIPGVGGEVLNGGGGTDTVVFAGPASGYTVTATGVGQKVLGPAGTYDLYAVEILRFSDRQIAVGSAGQTLMARPGGDFLQGGVGDDTFLAGTGADTVVGGGGSDTVVFSGHLASYDVSQSGGTTTVSGATGSASLTNIQSIEFADVQMVLTGPGATLIARNGGDTLIGSSGSDTLVAGPGADSIDGGAGVDTVVFAGAYSTYQLTLNGGATTVRSSGGTAALAHVEILRFSDRQMVLGSTGETLTARFGGDSLAGGVGDDTLISGPGADAIDGGGGTDTVVFSHGRSAYQITQTGGLLTITGPDGTDSLANVETLKFADKSVDVTSLGLSGIIGTAGNDTLPGGSGNDTIYGLAGNDTLNGAAGNDTLDGGPGNDSLNGGTGTDTATYADAPSGVTVSLAVTGAQNTGGAGTDTLTQIENLTGSGFGDTLTAAAAGSVLQGLGGDDTLVSGGGNDTLGGGTGNDTASYAGAKAAVTINLAISGQQNTGGAGQDTLILIENLIGSKFDDTLTPGGGAESIDGGSGTDTVVYAGAAAAYTIGHSGAVTTVTGGGQTDTLTNVEVLRFTDQQVVITDAGAAVAARTAGDTLVGGAGKDTLTGGAGNDTLIGNGGADTLNGGAGTNTAVFHGAFSAYTVTAAKVAGPDGTDSITKIQILQFNDRQVVSGSAGVTLHARSGGETLVGGAGGDTLLGSAANDTLIGGAGKDTLTGGGGADHFVFAALGDSKVATPDTITDWVSGDLIDLSAIDADTKTSGDQAFHFGATAGHTGDVVVHYDAAHSRTVVDLYIDKDAKADAEIWLTGNHALSSGDFVL